MLKKINPTRSLSGSHHDATVAELLGELEKRKRLIRRVHRLLPDNLRRHCRQASTEGSLLVLFADSPAWAAKLRLHAPEVLHDLQAKDARLESCQVRVSPPLESLQSTTARAPQARISPQAAAHLEQAALGIDHSELAACFLRMAKRG
jgi:hypothetical protein